MRSCWGPCACWGGARDYFASRSVPRGVSGPCASAGEVPRIIWRVAGTPHKVAGSHVRAVEVAGTIW
ncbi:UNVERIFIED_CONTAM: hypothetical protein FKN15_022619 [Acipenser sinensis]